MLAALFVSMTLVLAPLPAQPDLRGGEVTFNAAAPAAIEVKKVKTGHLLVKPVINGHAAGWFILDTGAGICVISKPHVDGLELAPGGEIAASGVGGGKQLPLFKARTLTLGPISLADHPIMEADLAFLEPLLGEDIAGVIGYGLLSRCIVEMDLETPAAAIHDPQSFKLPRGEWSELLMKERIPCIRASFEDHEGVFRLDTGSDAFVTFHQPTVEKWMLLDGRETSDMKLGGVGGFVPAKRGTVRWFEVGGVRQENINASFATEARGNYADATKDGNIGARMLKPFTLVLDYAGNRIAFLKREPTPAPQPEALTPPSPQGAPQISPPTDPPKR